MYLAVVLEALPLHIVLQHRKIAVLTHGVEVVAVRPKFTSPQEDFHLG